MARKTYVTGLDKAQKTFERMTPTARVELEKALDKGAAEIAGRARVLAPVATGELRDAIEVRSSLKGFVGAGAVGNFARMVQGEAGAIRRYVGVFPRKQGSPGWYAAFVEFGTRSRPATPFLTPAFFGLRKRVTGRVKRALKKAAKEAVRVGGR